MLLHAASIYERSVTHMTLRNWHPALCAVFALQQNLRFKYGSTFFFKFVLNRDVLLGHGFTKETGKIEKDREFLVVVK